MDGHQLAVLRRCHARGHQRGQRGDEDEAHGLHEFVMMNEGVGCAAVATGTEDSDSGRLAAAAAAATRRSKPLPLLSLLEGRVRRTEL
jgi:hypothetical protein